jgi:YD repeat-containing protein
MSPRSIAAALATASLVVADAARSHSADPQTDAVRVTVSINADGSRTVYEFDSLHHKAIATTTGKDGKTVGKIRYVVDEAGRFSSGEVYGPDDQLRFKTQYKYDATGKLSQETQLGKDEAVRNKIVYAYDKSGKQMGYVVYDAAGKLIRQTPGISRSASPANKRR